MPLVVVSGKFRYRFTPFLFKSGFGDVVEDPRPTNCANAPYFIGASASSMVVAPHCGANSLSDEKPSDEISATGGHRLFSPMRKRQYNTAEGKKQGIFDGTGGFRYNPCSI